MSNKIVPTIYRGIIDDVIASVQVDFEEYGVQPDVLQNLQAKWEAKLLATRVADFNGPPKEKTPDSPDSSATAPDVTPSRPTAVPDGQYQPAMNLALPPGAPQLALPGGTFNGQGMYAAGSAGSNGVNVKLEPEDPLRLRGGASSEAGPSGTSGVDYPRFDPIEQALRLRGGAGGEVDETKPFAYMPESMTEAKPEPNAAGLLPGDEVIDSDLDDSDDEGRDDDDERGEGWEGDIVFCVWDKVQRVKNKWKTTFKDGMIHINGRDYLFAKCSGEFEW